MAISGIVNTAASALQANGKRVQAIADNVVNLNTSEFVPRDVRTVSVGGTGISGGVATVIVEGQDNDAADQFARLIQTRTAYSFAAQTLETADELSRELLEITS